MSASEYISAKVGLLHSGTSFPFDLYVKVAAKFILYIAKGGELGEEQLGRLKKFEKLNEKNVDRMFIPIAQHDSFNRFIDASIEQVLESSSALEAEEKFQRIQEIASTAVEVVFSRPESKEAFLLCQKAASGLRKLVAENPKILKGLFAKKGKKTDVIENHCKNVSALSVKMAFALGYRGKDLDNLGAAALLHDIGLSNLKAEELEILFHLPPARWSTDERRIYIQHVADSVRVLANRDYVNKEIIDLVKNHEQKLQGEGYPDKIQKLSPLCQILSLVNVYDKKVTGYGMGPTEAMQEIAMEEVGHYELRYLEKLKEVLKAEEII